MSLIKKGTVAGITAVLLCVSFLFAACGESESDAGNQYTLNYAQLSLKIGESERLELSGNGMIILEGIEWSSSVVSVATVDENGRVQAVGTGETVITAAYGGAGYTFSVTVDEIQTIALSETELYLTEGDRLTLSLLRGNTILTENVSWATSDPAVATVAGGRIECLSPGETTITAEYGDETYECDLTVCASPAGIYYADITVAEMENAYFEFDLIINADKTYAYTRRDNENAPDGPVAGGLVNSGAWKFGDKNTIVFTYSGGEMRMRVRQDGTLVSVGELPTGGMDAALTFTKTSA